MNFPINDSPSHLTGQAMSGLTSNPGSVTITGTTQDDKLKKASEQFESMLVTSLWKDMEKTFGESDSDQPGFDTMQDMGLRAMTTALAASGGIGIARMLYQQIKHQQAAGDSQAAGEPPRP